MYKTNVFSNPAVYGHPNRNPKAPNLFNSNTTIKSESIASHQNEPAQKGRYVGNVFHKQKMSEIIHYQNGTWGADHFADRFQPNGALVDDLERQVKDAKK